MFVFKHQRWINNIFINIIAKTATRFHSAQILNDADINVSNLQFKILNFQKPKSVFAADIEILLAKKWEMQTRVIQWEIDDMQTRLNTPPSSATAMAPKTSKTAATGDSIVEINENLWILFLVIKYSFINWKLFIQIANNKFTFINIFKFSINYKLSINKTKYLKFENTIEFIHKKKNVLINDTTNFIILMRTFKIYCQILIFFIFVIV